MKASHTCANSQLFCMYPITILCKVQNIFVLRKLNIHIPSFDRQLQKLFILNITDRNFYKVWNIKSDIKSGTKGKGVSSGHC